MRGAVLLGCAVAVALLFVPAAWAGWSRPFDLAPPQSSDVIAPMLAISPAGSAAAAFGTQDVDVPGSAQALVAVRSSRGVVTGPTAAPGAAQVLDLAYGGRTPELLTGTAASGAVCCSRVQISSVTSAGAPRTAHTIVSGLGGQTLGLLVPLTGREMLAAVATETGVWVAQSGRGYRFGNAHRLTGRSQMPESLAAAWLGGENTIVGWTSAPGIAGQAAPRSITVAGGTRAGAPHRAKALVTVAAGRRIDQMGLAARGGSATAAWVQSWADRGGDHSVVMVRDLAPHAASRQASPSGRLASGLVLTGDVAGDQGLGWSSCSTQGSCTMEAATRSAHGSFSAAHSLGPVDPDEDPAVAVGPGGQVLVAWVSGGRPMAALGSAGRPLGRAHALSRSPYALDVAAAWGSSRDGLVGWSQGTLSPSVVGAAYTGP